MVLFFIHRLQVFNEMSLNDLEDKLESFRNDPSMSDRYPTDNEAGICLIFNQMNFDGRISNLIGSDKDVTAIEECMKEFGFEIYKFIDKKVGEIEEIINEASRVDFTCLDCLVVVAMSHGRETELLANDKPFDIKATLLNPFTSDRCPTLARKPKVFLFQACCGSSEDRSKVWYSSGCVKIEDDGEIEQELVVPQRSDLLLGFASFEGYKSFRTPDESFFIQSLMNIISADYHKDDLLSMLTTANRFISAYLQSKKGSSQVSTITSTLTRKIYFVKKQASKVLLSFSEQGFDRQRAKLRELSDTN